MNGPTTNLLAVVATLALACTIVLASYIGFLYGRESGVCSARCASATQGQGRDHYYGGTCHCTLNGQEVHPL